MSQPVPSIRDVMAIDGEGYSPQGAGGEHWYTLLNVYDSRRGGHWAIRGWDGGLSTTAIVRFLVSLLSTHSTLWCGFFLNYDITMWLRDLSDQEKTALWQAGWVMWRDGYGAVWRIEWIPSKLFFVGLVNERDEPDKHSKWHWPYPHRLIYDVSGFSQKSFVKTLTDWQEDIGISNQELAWIGEQKEARSSFTEEAKEEIEAYNQRECVWLARYVQTLDRTFQGEGIKLNAWHGPGALASWYLKAHNVNEFIGDPVDEPGVMGAIMRAYFGGRNEIMRLGKISELNNYDINSAYPAASVDLPDLRSGQWDYTSSYTDEPYALWHVRWDLRGYDQVHVMPFPVRHKGGVLYPDRGEGWYHACELDMAIFALLRAGCAQQAIEVLEGFVYTPDDYVARPLGFVNELANTRVRYKTSDPKRAVPYKYALNSLYGKFAQHSAELGQTPRWQSYYAAGYITAKTRARLLEFIWQKGHTDADVVMLATDGVFCTEVREHVIGSGLGQFEYQGVLADVYVVQPGVWYTRHGVHRTRGFGSRALSYQDVDRAWRQDGPRGIVTYRETRFVGLGASSGWGDFSRYGRWIESEREVVFAPAHKFYRFSADGGLSYRLWPPTMPPGVISEPYVPMPPNDSALARALWEESAGRVEAQDQPDFPDPEEE